MRRYISGLLEVMAIVVAIALGWCWHLSSKSEVVYAEEVFDAISNSTKHYESAEVVLLGDSVANQLFSPRRYSFEDGKVISLTSNYAITPMGNAMLLRNVLDANKQIKHVFYLIRPRSLCNDAQASFSLRYFIYPFTETHQRFDPNVMRHLQGRFGRFVFESDRIRRFLYNSIYLYTLYEKLIRYRIVKDFKCPPSICVDAVKGMTSLCTHRSVKFHMLSLPVNAVEAENSRQIVRSIRGLGYVDFEMPQTLPDYNFSDGIHLRTEFLHECRNKIIGRVNDLVKCSRGSVQ